MFKDMRMKGHQHEANRFTVALTPRQFLRYGFGFLWLVDGLLQAQPTMFSPDFYANYPNNIMESLLQSVADGQPAWLADAIYWGARVWGQHPVWSNLLAIAVQLAIGFFMLVRVPKKFEQIVLFISIVWALIIWFFGEGMGGVFAGSSYFDGWPGAALLYAITAGFLLLPERLLSTARLRLTLRWGLSVYWLIMAAIQALPDTGFWQGEQMMNQFANTATLPQPRLLSVPIQHFSIFSSHHPLVWNSIFVGLMFLLSIYYAMDLHHRLFSAVVFVWLAWSWWFGQDFGGVYSGMGTDFNSIAVIILWTITSWILYRQRRTTL